MESKQQVVNPLEISIQGLATIGMEKDILIFNLKMSMEKLTVENAQLKKENELLKNQK